MFVNFQIMVDSEFDLITCGGTYYRDIGLLGHGGY